MIKIQETKTNNRFFETVPTEIITNSAEWATRLKCVEFYEEASVTVWECFAGEYFDKQDTLVKVAKEDCTIVEVFADDTVTFYASPDVYGAIEFANNMIALLSARNK